MTGTRDGPDVPSGNVFTDSCPSLFRDSGAEDRGRNPMTGERIIRRTDTDDKAAQALLRLETEKGRFSRITVTDVCREADISRSTFYQRYRTMDGLLRMTILKIFKKVETTGKNLRLVRWDSFHDGEPLCLYVRKNPELQGLVYDPEVRDRIVSYTLSHYSNENWQVMEEYGDMDRRDYDTVQAYQMYGCLSMMAAHRDDSDEEWAKIKNAIDNVIRLHLRDHVI